MPRPGQPTAVSPPKLMDRDNGATFLTSVAVGLRIVKLNVPESVSMGQEVSMSCDFDLEGDELYSVKWYKDNVEFYRYLPIDNPPGQTYGLLGINVDLVKSNLTHVQLRKSDLNTEGTYGCEVSAEAPSFRTVKHSQELRVFVLPKESPVIQGTEPRYQVGDEVNVTCFSRPSKPPANLKWFINERPADPAFETPLAPAVHVDGLQGNVLMLSFVATPQNFRYGPMKLRCTATISTDYSSSTEDLIIGYKAHSAASQAQNLENNHGPRITGGKTKYEVGDTVDVNCTSAQSMKAAELRWFINDKEPHPEFIINYPPNQESVLGLRFRVQQNHFHTDEMRLKCTATFSRVLDMSSEETVVGSNQQTSGLHVSDNMASGGMDHEYGASNRGVVPGLLAWWLLKALSMTLTFL